MASKLAASNDDRLYTDYEPPFEWQTEDGTNTLIVFLPGYKKQDLRVQITSRANLRVFGERHQSENKWIRFLKEIPTPPDSNTNQISANFEHGMLYVKVPKATHQTKPLHEETKQPTTEIPKPQKNGYQEKVNSKTISEKQSRKEASDVNKRINMDEIKQVVQKKSGRIESNRGSDENKLSDGASHKEKRANEREEITSTSMSERAKYKLRLEGNKQAIQDLFMETKKRRVTNLIMAVIFLLLIGFYVKNAVINPKGESKSSEL